mmetsp:Transcript_21186/g.42257  ORF Transcript_21186/g.42257 Transcript_21186/m.42257 type:complete len:314 (-) Transcript_21186:8-949(-)
MDSSKDAASLMELDGSGAAVKSKKVKSSKSLVKEVGKIVLLIVVLGGFFFAGTQVNEAIKSVREDWKGWSLGWILPVVIIVQYVRRSVPPVYALVGPFSSVVLLCLSDKLGAYDGAILYQALKLEELIIFPTLRYCHTSAVAKVLEEEDHGIWWLSDTLVDGLKLFDHTYRSQVVGKPWYKICFTVWMFNMTYFFNDYICLFWFATRSEVPYRLYCFAYTIGLFLEFPKTLFKFKTYTAILDASGGDKFWDVFADSASFAWYEIVLLGATTCVATLWVHGLHIWMVVSAIRRKIWGEPKGASPQNWEIRKNPV